MPRQLTYATERFQRKLRQTNQKTENFDKKLSEEKLVKEGEKKKKRTHRGRDRQKRR
jgi:hypothetical protein